MPSYRVQGRNLLKGKKGIVPVATVLVVDDEWDIRELLSDIITDAGLGVIQAENGEVALKRAQTDLPDLILLDVWMPGFDGFQVLEKLRENQSTRHIPVVLLTAMPPFQGEKEGLEWGVTHYIHKPWEAGVVEATVRVVLREAVAMKGSSGAAGLESSHDPSDNREDGSKHAEEEVVELPVDSKNVDVKTPEVSIFQEPRALAGLRSGRRRRRAEDGQEDRIRTADRLKTLEQKMGGGLPVGSLNLAVGAAGSGKSVLCEHLAYGALVGGFEVAYFTSEHTPDSLTTQMASIGLDTVTFLGDGSLQIFPVPDPVEGEDSAPMLGQLSLAIEQLSQDSQFIVVDSITDLAGSCSEQNVIAFFSAGRRLTNQRKTVMMSIHNYVFSSDMFSRLRNLCDGYFTLNSEQVMGRPMRTLEINKINTTELITENLVSFVVEPEIGMRVIPLSRSKA
ncbi:MAG: response regulator [Chloroflexi bacterium]|nr:response regulator [Chloroflexota bacterium]